MEYILFIHKNTDSKVSKEEWDDFFNSALDSGLFQGGSEINNRIQLGKKSVPDIICKMKIDTGQTDSRFPKIRR